MGLALSRGLAEAMDGSLTVKTSEGAGATFSITLPETTAPVAALPPPVDRSVLQPTPAIPAGSAQVLYVEDNLRTFAWSNESSNAGPHGA